MLSRQSRSSATTGGKESILPIRVVQWGTGEGDGQESAYNRWYDEVHIPELLAVPGIVKATRYKVVQSNQPWPYVAAYEIETDDLPATMAAMHAGMGPFDPSFRREGSGNILAIALGD